jgi:membrane peptidoglycan carboxypeptidase
MASRENYAKLVGYLVVAEDHRFFNHPGYDIIGICRAIYKDIFKGKREGASTIEQQLVRVLTEDYRFCFSRKIKEIYLAAMLHRLADKYTLASAYLYFANYGTDFQGLNRILQKFDVKLEPDLDDVVCAEIVARLKYPEPRRYNPERMAQIENRRNHILKLFKEEHDNK